MTVRDLLSRSLRLIGVLASGETADGSQIVDALSSVNAMIDSMKNDGFMIYENQVIDLSLVASQQSYTIGDGGDFDVARPNDITRAKYLLNDIEYRVEIITSLQWADICYKAQTSTIPCKLFYNPASPLGILNIWPKPDATGTLKLYTTKPIEKFTSVNAIVDLPPGYEDLIVYGGVERIAPEYGKEITQTQMNILMKAKAGISRKNIEPQYMTTDPTGAGSCGRYSDHYRIFGGS